MGQTASCTSRGALLLVAAANGDTATAQEVGVVPNCNVDVLVGNAAIESSFDRAALRSC